MEQTYKTDREILDEEEERLYKKIRHGSSWRFRLADKLRPGRKHLYAVLAIALVLFFIKIIYSAIVAPPVYTDAETKQNETRLLRMVEVQSPEIKRLFTEALAILEKHPRYFAKVVNNIHEIQVRSGACPYACVYSTSYVAVYGVTDLIKEAVLPEANFNKKTLIINPRGVKYFNTGTVFASLLVHETDHVEYMESSRLRRAGLFVRCNPLLNPHISVYSTLPSITHRVKIMEICAEKEQISFHEATDTYSGYETDTNIFMVGLGIIGGFFQTAYYEIKYFNLNL